MTSNTDYIPEPILDFNDLDLPKSVFVGLERDNITEPTPIQAMGISAGMAGKNIIGVSRTASGKTLAFLLPAIKDILSDPNAAQSWGFSRCDLIETVLVFALFDFLKSTRK